MSDTDTDTDFAVFVLPVDPTHMQAVTTVLRDALKAAWDDGLFDGEQPWGPVHLAIREDADMVMDVFRKGRT